jgi:hypothetical protein
VVTPRRHRWLSQPSSGNVATSTASAGVAEPPLLTGSNDGRLWQALQSRSSRWSCTNGARGLSSRTVRTHLGAISSQLTDLGSRLDAPAELCAVSAMASS